MKKTNSMAGNETTIADAFRGPSDEASLKKSEGLRIPINTEKPLRVTQIREKGWAAVWGLLFPNATVIELSGRMNVKLRIFPTHVAIEKRRWFVGSGFFGRFRITIPVYDEFGDSAKHQIRVQSKLAFLYPFVPMHVEVAVDDEVVFGQGKFEQPMVE